MNANVSARKIGHASFDTPDLERELDHYLDVVGLVPAGKADGRIVLSTTVGEEVLVLSRGTTPQLTALSFQVQPDFELSEIARQLTARGLHCERRTDTTPRLPEVVVFQDPSGLSIELYSAFRQMCDPGRSAGIAPLKLGHVAYAVPDAKPLVDFYTKTLGFRVSDWMGDYFAFLRCGPDHHTLNFINGETTRMHHIAFELKDWSHVQTACEILGQRKKPIIWGPGRHGVGHNIFLYHRDQDDHIVEFYIEMDQMSDEALGYFDPRPWHHDRPQKPKVWERMTAALTWGTPPTPDFLRTHFKEEAAAGRMLSKT